MTFASNPGFLSAALHRSPAWHAIAPLLVLILACLPRPAAAEDCELALVHATNVVDLGRRAWRSENYYDAGNLASSARIPAISAARAAKACGCPEAIPFLAEAATAASRANTVDSLGYKQQYGYRIQQQGEAAVAALQRCPVGAAPPSPSLPK
jgi:hypothetical protein